MKLADLTAGGLLKPVGKRLTTMSGVPAGKAAKAELGVVGITIGYKQSTGDTSRSDPPMPKYKTIPGNKQGTL